MKLLENLLPYIIVIIIVVLIRTFIVTPVKVHGNSMYPTLKGNEIMLLNKLGKIDRYDIVVVKLEDREDNLIKRVIGLPNETIEIRDSIIYINDEKIEDTYALGETTNVDKITLGSDEYFILGDNRIVSLDSRIFGKIKRKDIKGTTNFIMYPFNRIGKVK